MEEKTKSKGYVLRKLFFACLYLSTFTFGGGYVIVTLLKEKFVDHYHYFYQFFQKQVDHFLQDRIYLMY